MMVAVETPEGGRGDEDLRAILESQYRAALAMLGRALERCPDDLWADDSYPNRFWHVAYHALFYTHLYLQAPQCGFWWYSVSKLEHQLVSIRHLQHHTAQLVDRLRTRAGIGIGWVGGKSEV